MGYYSYDMINRRTQASLPDGTKWRYGYDRLSQVVSGGSFRYAYDGIGSSSDFIAWPES